jgi:SPP1 gp7 family putative phage head morphogenesis protein
VETSKAERLMRTELARVQIASQEQSLKANGFDKYEFIALGDACGTCKGLDGKTFTLKQLKISGNAPPMHPNCRCAIAPATNDPEYEAWLDGFYKHGLSFEEWKAKKNLNAIRKMAVEQYHAKVKHKKKNGYTYMMMERETKDMLIYHL